MVIACNSPAQKPPTTSPGKLYHIKASSVALFAFVSLLQSTLFLLCSAEPSFVLESISRDFLLAKTQLNNVALQYIERPVFIPVGRLAHRMPLSTTSARFRSVPWQMSVSSARSDCSRAPGSEGPLEVFTWGPYYRYGNGQSLLALRHIRCVWYITNCRVFISGSMLVNTYFNAQNQW